MTYGLYFFIGLIYALINGLIRKIETNGDPMQPFAWVLLWPIGVITLAIQNIYKAYKRLTTR